MPGLSYHYPLEACSKDSPLSFRVGDRVYSIGSDAKIQTDYGSQVLEIIALDIKTKRAICQTVRFEQAVGIAFADLSKF